MTLGWRGTLGLMLSALLLWYAFHDIRWSEVAAQLRHANVGLLVLAAVAATGIFPLRARRWRTILDPVEPNVPFGPLWRPTAIGMMVSNVVPGRAGELARAFALTREVPRVPFSTAFASIAVDRVFDSLVVLLLLFAAMLDPRFPRGAQIKGLPASTFAAIGIGIVAAAIVVLYLLVSFPTQIIGLFELFARRVAPRLEERGRAILTAFANGLSVLRSPRRFAIVLWWTLLHWLLNALAFYIAFVAVGVDVRFSAALFVQGIIAISVALPSSPGFFGPFEVAAKLGLGLFRISETVAVTWAIGFHVLSFIPITLIGAYYFLHAGLRMDQVRHAGEDTRDAA